MANEKQITKNIKDTTDQSFNQDVVKGSGLTVVDFWAEWCGPCKMLTPTLEAVASQFSSQMTVCKVNVDNNPLTPTQFHVRGIPTLIFFKDGKAVDQLVGNQPRDAIVKMVEKHIA